LKFIFNIIIFTTLYSKLLPAEAGSSLFLNSNKDFFSASEKNDSPRPHGQLCLPELDSPGARYYSRRYFVVWLSTQLTRLEKIRTFVENLPLQVENQGN